MFRREHCRKKESEPKVVKVRVIGGKNAQAAFYSEGIL